MESNPENKSNSRVSQNADSVNGSSHFIDEITFPFIPCHYSKHKKFGPQTVISHFNFNTQKNNYILFCNTCLKDLEKKDSNFHPHDIEEFVENFLRKLTAGCAECPIPSPSLGQAYELKQQNVQSFKKRIEKEVQVIHQTFEEIIQEVTKTIQERRDYVIKCFNSIFDIFSQSYELFNVRYERLFKSNEKLARLQEINEIYVKDELGEIKTAEEYQKFVKELKELDELSQELANREKNTQELEGFSETLKNLCHVLPPVPTNRKPMAEFCINNAKQALSYAFSEPVFKKPKVIEEVRIF